MHSQSILENNGIIYHSRQSVFPSAIRENIRPVELAKYGIFLYWASSTGRIFFRSAQLRTLACQLWEFTKGCATEVFPMDCLSKRTSQIWPRTSLCAPWYEGILNVDNVEGGTLVAHPAGKMLGLSAHWVICRQGQAGPSVRMHSVKTNVMPYHTVIPQNHHSLLDQII